MRETQNAKRKTQKTLYWGWWCWQLLGCSEGELQECAGEVQRDEEQ